MTMKIVSPTRYDLRFDVCEDGSQRLTFMQGTAGKTSSIRDSR